MYRAYLSRRLGPAFADAAVDAAFDTEDKHGYPAGWGTSPRPAPTSASYKPAHGGYPDTPVPPTMTTTAHGGLNGTSL